MGQDVGVIDYAAGNSPSVLRALQHLSIPARPVSRPEEIAGCSHVILPGVGAAGATMASLTESGLTAALTDAVLGGLPYVGICIGLQVLFDQSEEDDAKCLGWLPGTVRRLPAGVRVPQIGWNLVRSTAVHGADVGTPIDGYFYFVNSYVVHPSDSAVVVAEADYGCPFPAAVRSGSIFATQFHLEKSGPAGLALLRAVLTDGVRREGAGC